jgi:hypothetical protein
MLVPSLAALGLGFLDLTSAFERRVSVMDFSAAIVVSSFGGNRIFSLKTHALLKLVSSAADTRFADSSFCGWQETGVSRHLFFSFVTPTTTPFLEGTSSPIASLGSQHLVGFYEGNG